ncbi:GAF domain-containing sensor histidine kinase [Iningainema tapete]|uniref:Circadian input-output histidine kinase CikA n=1 Tax=Iningainema tapete BLCC-T55 TaxID=2748662 RepID=A0A8J6XI03_9CYAN|nr:ATP-binding protein [Iningainema tapete]MBD2776304.1 GAF domain-containing protein [Iningainema tapete BLCC-T55]
MLISPDLSFEQTLSVDVFNQLGELLQQMAQAVGNQAVVLTEAVLVSIRIPQEWERRRFTMVVYEQFCALLLGSPQNTLAQIQDSQLHVSFSFNSEACASFLSQLRDLFGHDSQTYHNLQALSQIPGSNDATLVSKFSLLLLKYFLPESTGAMTQPSTILYSSVCQPVEDALEKQIAQERLLNQVTTQIRTSMDLSVIMETAVARVREFLELDRLVVYKFNQLKSHNKNPIPDIPLEEDLPGYTGCIVYEVLSDHSISSVLNYREKNCLQPRTECWEKYRHGFTLVVDDVEKTYTLEKCLLNFLRKIKVRAKLASPIIFEDKLWGLLIAHKCYEPYHWSESEKNLLSGVAEQLAIAIYQAELMQNLTQEKQSLEQRVIERTMALHDALVAAEAASRLKSEFLATISHELLTPLTYVIGMSSTLLRWSFGELSQRQRDYLQTIHDSGERLLAMINDILDLSQIEAGKAVLNITEFSLVNTVETTLKQLEEKATLQQVNIQLDLQINQQGDRFTADALRVEKILWNLLSNAIKFTPQGGNIILRLWREDKNAVFQVEDTGIGIPEDQLSLLFEKFHQLDTPYRRRYEGTGLGLALTKQLVELHRGRIEVESTPNVGSIFTVWIPVQPAPVLSE